MGSADGARPHETPQHPVYLNGYEISKYEITWTQYQAFIDAGGYLDREVNGFWSKKGVFLSNLPIWSTEPAGFGVRLTRPQYLAEDHGPPGFRERGHWPPLPDDPVVGISYWEAEAFCRFVGGRLPTEAEWEKAASWGPDATSPYLYPWGNHLPSPLPGNGYEISRGYGRVASVNDPLYEGDRSRYGVYGMGGNLREWVADMYDPDFYGRGPADGTAWNNPFNFMAKRLDFRDEAGAPLPIDWVTRGGRYDEPPHSGPEKFLCSYRRNEGAISRHHTIGFRVAWDLVPRESEPPHRREDRPGSAVIIPAGRYRVGHNFGTASDTGSRPDESPQHGVCLNPFWIGKYEVTWGEYRKFMEAGGYNDPQWWSADGWKYRLDPAGNGGFQSAVVKPDLMGGPRPLIGYDWKVFWKGPWNLAGEWSSPPDDHPVVGVSWFEAEAYCKYVGGRLPKEVEWEVAATWNPETGYPQHFTWGNLFTFTQTARVGNTGDDPKYGGAQTSPVGMYPEGKSPFGCYDMAGNAFEWTSDWHHPDSYSQHSSECGGPVTTPDWMKVESPHSPTQDPIPGWKVNRGGGFDPTFEGTYSQRARTRGTDGAQTFRNFTFGFRVAWDRNPESISNAQLVRPRYTNGTDQETLPTSEVRPSPPQTASTYERAHPTANPSRYFGAIAIPGQEDWYRVHGPAGAIVRIDLDANGGPDEGKKDSPLDAAIEVWNPGIPVPVLTRDDEIVLSGNANYRPTFLDPPIVQHRIPGEGFFWIKVRAYYWPAEGSQEGLSKGERSYCGPDYTYELSITAPELSENHPVEETGAADLNSDGRIDAGDLLALLASAKGKSSKALQADLDGDGRFTRRDVFLLDKVWSQYGQAAKRIVKDVRPAKESATPRSKDRQRSSKRPKAP